MNIIGPLPRSRWGSWYVLEECDYTTRYPDAIPLWTIDAEHTDEKLVDLFARMGIPKEFLNDQGSNFTSQLLAEMYKLFHVEALRTSPHHPRMDNLVEMFNKTLIEMLCKTTTEHPNISIKLMENKTNKQQNDINRTCGTQSYMQLGKRRKVGEGECRREDSLPNL